MCIINLAMCIIHEGTVVTIKRRSKDYIAICGVLAMAAMRRPRRGTPFNKDEATPPPSPMRWLKTQPRRRNVNEGEAGGRTHVTRDDRNADEKPPDATRLRNL